MINVNRIREGIREHHHHHKSTEEVEQQKQQRLQNGMEMIL